MKTSQRLEAALQFAAKKHAGQKRLGGEPYISHPMAVARLLKEDGYDEEYQIVGLFHDLLEDTDATDDEIATYGSPQILEAVQLLTKKKDYVMSEYIAGIKKNRMAFAVKGADRLHNLQSAFCAGEDFKRKYILESLEWYMDFDKRIPEAISQLESTLEAPLIKNCKEKP